MSRGGGEGEKKGRGGLSQGKKLFCLLGKNRGHPINGKESSQKSQVEEKTGWVQKRHLLSEATGIHR